MKNGIILTDCETVTIVLGIMPGMWANMHGELRRDYENVSFAVYELMPHGLDWFTYNRDELQEVSLV